jgi:hypothetical protein
MRGPLKVRLNRTISSRAGLSAVEPARQRARRDIGNRSLKHVNLVPNPNEQAAVALGLRMADGGESLRKIAAAWKTERLGDYDAKSVARILSRAASRMEIEMRFDPEEIVTLYGQGQMTLRTAIRKVMTRPTLERAGATIFRTGEPSILDLAKIEQLAAEWETA